MTSSQAAAEPKGNSRFSFFAEPAIWVAAVDALIILLVAFGVPITDDQKVAVIGFLSAILAIVGAIIVRSQVTPTSKLKDDAAA